MRAVISLYQRSTNNNDWVAEWNEAKGYWGCGKTQEEALRDLLATCIRCAMRGFIHEAEIRVCATRPSQHAKYPDFYVLETPTWWKEVGE